MHEHVTSSHRSVGLQTVFVVRESQLLHGAHADTFVAFACERPADSDANVCPMAPHSRDECSEPRAYGLPTTRALYGIYAPLAR